VTVGGKSHEVTDIKDTAAGIVWSVAVSGDVLASDDTVTATLEVTDKAGNSSAPVSETRDYAVALDPPTVEITLPIAGDNWVNAEEQDEVKLSGTTVNVAKDREVTLRISDANSATADVIATAQVDANGNWSTLSLDLSGLDDGALVVKADVSDNAGNTASDQETIDKDVKGPTTAVTIESISIDSGSQNDFVTNDNDGLTINAKLTAPLAPGERLQYSSGGDIWEDITSSVNGMAVIHDDPKLTSTATIQMRTVDEHGNLGAADSQLVTIDTLRAVNDVGEAGIGLATVVDDVDRILGESSRSIARGGVPGNAKAYAQGAWLAPITFTVEEGGQMKVAIEASIKTEVPILEQHLTIYVKNEKGQTVATIEYKDPLWEGGSWYNGLPIGPDAKILTLGAGTYAVEAVYTDGWLLDAGAPANTARVSVTQMSLATKVVDIETAEGNILTNDSLGVSFDSLKVAGAGSSGFQDVVNQDTKVRGEFGTLTIDPDGAYEYTLDVDPTVSAAAAVAALAGKTDVFQSELMRADGSYETASLSIEIMNLLDQAAQPPFGLPW
jgi:VCBS repeat-containing protein